MSEKQEQNNRDEKKERAAVWLYPSTLAQIEKTLPLANCRTVSEFLEDAAAFYVGYIAAQNSEDFLSPVFMSALRAALNDSEGRTARLLFKLSVEISMMMHVIAATSEIDDDTLRRLRGKCIKDVKGTRGAVTFDDAVHYQNS